MVIKKHQFQNNNHNNILDIIISDVYKRQELTSPLLPYQVATLHNHQVMVFYGIGSWINSRPF